MDSELNPGITFFSSLNIDCEKTAFGLELLVVHLNNVECKKFSSVVDTTGFFFERLHFQNLITLLGMVLKSRNLIFCKL